MPQSELARNIRNTIAKVCPNMNLRTNAAALGEFGVAIADYRNQHRFSRGVPECVDFSLRADKVQFADLAARFLGCLLKERLSR